MNLKPLSDEKLRSNARSLVKIERGVLIALLHRLREIEHRRLFSAWGYPSLFEYAIQELKYSESQAQRRISAMRLLRDVPEAEEMIASGDSSLTNIELAQAFFSKKRKDGEVLSKEEKLEALSGLENKSTRKAQEIIEEMDPEMAAHKQIARMEKPVCPKKSPSAPKVKRETTTEATGSGRTEANTRTEGEVPLSAAATDRYVRQRDGHKCSNCGSEYALQSDHINPRACGGSDLPANRRLLCRNCNLRAAIEVFGMDKMGQYLRERQVAYGLSG